MNNPARPKCFCGNLLENEMNRLLRTEIFNFVSRRRARGVDSHSSSSENRVLRGPSNVEEKKLLHRSPIVKELILGEPDYRMLIIGIKQYEPYFGHILHGV